MCLALEEGLNEIDIQLIELSGSGIIDSVIYVPIYKANLFSSLVIKAIRLLKSRGNRFEY